MIVDFELYNKYYDTTKEVSYFSVNLYDNDTCSFKIYEDTEFCTKNADIVDSQLFKEINNESWEIKKVVDTKFKNAIRIESLLKVDNITKSNLLIRKLADNYPFIKNNKSILNRCAKMRISDTDLSPMYRLSYTQIECEVIAFKFYFMTRLITTQKKEVHSNTFFLNCFIESLPARCEKLIKYAMDLARNNKYNLHLLGIDCNADNNSKYKLYFISDYISKNDLMKITSVYLYEEENTHNKMYKNVLESISNSYPLLKISGFAISIDDNANKGINIYYNKR